MDGGWKSWEGYNRPQRYGRPPQAPGSWLSAVPSWEKRFCTSVCLVPWWRICAAKALMSAHKNIVDWDDSAALEAFQNAKAHYWAEINGLPCDIPMLGPNIYIDKVDHNAVIDPKLVEDLEKVPPPPGGDIITSVDCDPSVSVNKPIPVMRWSDAEDENFAERPSVHPVKWEASLDKNVGHIQPNGWDEARLDKKVSCIQPTGWDDVEPTNGESKTWEPFLDKKISHTQGTAWGDAAPTNADPGNVSNQNGGWGDGTGQECSWGGGRDNTSWGNGRGTSWDHSDYWNNEQSRSNSRKRNGDHYDPRYLKSRHHMSNYQTSNNSWKGYRERNVPDYPYEETMHAGKPMTARQWKSKHSSGPMNHQKSAESAGARSWQKYR